jgi:hypothetical protein
MELEEIVRDLVKFKSIQIEFLDVIKFPVKEVLNFDGKIKKKRSRMFPLFLENKETKIFQIGNKYIDIVLKIRRTCKETLRKSENLFKFEWYKESALHYQIITNKKIIIKIDSLEMYNYKLEKQFLSLYDSENFSNKYRMKQFYTKLDTIIFPIHRIPVFNIYYYKEIKPFFILFMLEKNNEMIVKIKDNSIFDLNIFKIISMFN